MSYFKNFWIKNFSIAEAYGHMISARPSKILSGWTYESQPKALRSSRTAGKFFDTEVPDDTEDDCPKTDFQEFCKLLNNAKRIADETKKSHFFIWRGYKAYISSQLPKLSSHELERRFKLAMDSINENQKKSNQVRKKYLLLQVRRKFVLC